MCTRSEFLKHFHNFTWDVNPEAIEKRSTKIIRDIKQRIEKLTCLPEDKINFESVCESLADIEAEIERESSIIDIYLNTSPIDIVQEKCFKLSKTWSEFFGEFTMRKDIYDLLTKVQSIEISLSYESALYLEKSLLHRMRAGLHLEANVRENLKNLLKQISDLCIDFSENISVEDTEIKFKKQDLLGLPDDFFQGLDEKYGNYTVTLTSPNVVQILKQCKVVKTRQIVEKAYNSRCMSQNIKILEEILELRNQHARILGYNTHADYVTEILMSKSSAKVHEFLTSLFEKIYNASKKEMDRLLELKKNECQEMEVSFDGKINPYDCGYYQNMVEELDYQIDKSLLKEYFPFEHVTEQILEIYQTLLGLKFEKVSDPPVIHHEVSLYAVYDKATNSLIGYFYMDLFERTFKTYDAACYGIQAGCHYRNKPQVACAVIIANFNKPLPDKPSLLSHEEVVTYFHELGHVMHRICSKTQYSIFHGTSVEHDFVEAPSHMLENWCWEKEFLKKISCHYKSSNPIPDDLIDKIIKSRRANIATACAEYLCLSMFDHLIHTSPKECMIKYTGIEPTPGTNFAASFAQICCGYDAKYYGYLWSQVYSYDMFFSRFKKEGIFSSVPGLSYRNLILQPGSTKDASEMVREFLGRDPIIDPYMEMIGIK